MKTRSTSPARRWAVLASVIALLGGGLVLGAAPVSAADPEPQTYTITYQCDPNLPGYGTNSLWGAELSVEIGDTVRVVMDGWGCKEGSMHTRGDLGQFETTPAWSGSCCIQQASGTVFTMKVVKFTTTRYGAGVAALAFFKTNSAAMNSAVIRVKPPVLSVPRAPAITDSLPDEEQATVSFTRPFDGNSPITSYEWRIVAPADQARNWTSLPATATEVDIKGLKVGTKYTVELRAVNAIGAGPVATATFTTKSQPPGPPTDLSADPGDGEVTVSFTPGTTGGSPIRAYRYRIDGGDWQDAGTDASPVRITGLENGQTYSIELRALNQTETGLASDSIEVAPSAADDGESVTLWVCHKDGDSYDPVIIEATMKTGVGEHGSHSGDIVPAFTYFPSGKNWDDDGFWIWAYGCQDQSAPDTDGDGVADVMDTDDDGDGIPDAIDPDDDGDGIPDFADADHDLATDSDRDGIPDAGESDDDGDGIADVFDSDADGDGIPDVEDQDRALPVDSDGDGVPDAVDADDDGDCIADAKDRDRDGDGVPDVVDDDVDNDGIPNSRDVDIDGDGIVNGLDPDVDGDGVANADEADDAGTAQPGSRAVSDVTCSPASGGLVATVRPTSGGAPVAAPLRVPVDTDGDGISNVRDTDDDGDGIPDATDRDADGDGVRDAVDGDANGDGVAEAKDQPLVSAYSLPDLEAGRWVDLTGGSLKTVAGQRATVRVTCAVAGAPRSSAAAVPTGDVEGARSGDLCQTTRSGGRLRIVVAGDYPTRVTVAITAPATGEYRPLSESYTTTVR